MPSSLFVHIITLLSALPEANRFPTKRKQILWSIILRVLKLPSEFFMRNLSFTDLRKERQPIQR